MVFVYSLLTSRQQLDCILGVRSSDLTLLDNSNVDRFQQMTS